MCVWACVFVPLCSLCRYFFPEVTNPLFLQNTGLSSFILPLDIVEPKLFFLLCV